MLLTFLWMLQRRVSVVVVEALNREATGMSIATYMRVQFVSSPLHVGVAVGARDVLLLTCDNYCAGCSSPMHVRQARNLTLRGYETHGMSQRWYTPVVRNKWSVSSPLQRQG